MLTESKDTVLATLDTWRDEYQTLRRDIHQHPETAFEEVRTASIVARELRRYGLEVREGIAGTGVVGTLKRGASTRAIALRADMDALNMHEENGFAHCSVHGGKMHACGHDGHTTTLLAAARYLSEHGGFDGVLHFIFQPAEENEGGARAMIEAGLFEQAPCEAVFGLHNIPGIPLGRFAARPGAMMAGFDIFEISFIGKGGHAAMPHEGRDPIPAAASFVLAAQTIVARNVAPHASAVVSVTQVHAGAAFNVIPERAQVAGTARFFDPAVQTIIEERLTTLAQQTAAAFGVTAEVKYQRRYPPTLNAPEETELCLSVLREAFGDANVDDAPTPMMAAEDFAFMLREKPGCYIWAGADEGPDTPKLHNPHYDFNDALIPLGASYWVKLARTALREGANQQAR